MPRETVSEKAVRLLRQRRLRVEHLGNHVHAHVQGDHAAYIVSYRRGVATCTCPARGLCAHRVALTLVADTLLTTEREAA